MHETRIRDMLTADPNLKILSEMIMKETGEKHEFRLISKELPLPRDLTGLQNRYCDIVLTDEDLNLYIIELKNSIKSIKSVESQVMEYKELMKNTLYHVNNSRISYQHKIFLKYFEYSGVDPAKIKDIIPLIMSVSHIKESLKRKTDVPCLSIESLKPLIKNYTMNRINRFKSVYGHLWDHKMQEKINSLVKMHAIKGFAPLVYQYVTCNQGKTHLQIVFESLNNYKKKYIDMGELTGNYSNLNIPGVFLAGCDPENVFERILHHHESLSDPRFSIQIFRSGLTNPIIYLEVREGIFLPMIQTKPVTFAINSSLVNDVIAFDAKENIHENK